MASSHASLSAAADDRKARLAKLRSIKRKQPDDEIVPPELDHASPAVANMPDTAAEAPDVSRLYLSGRNYDPETRGVKLGFEAPPNLAAGDNTVEAKAAGIEAEIRQEQEDEGSNDDENKAAAGESSKGIDLFKLQPKKPNWDLKRELNKRLEPLNLQTENAIARLVRERLQAKQTSQNQSQGESSRATAGTEEGMLEGSELVEGIRIREQEAAEDERREREAEDED